ncbi:MAG TPA: hypothetical protein VH370_15910 [Humisphaera sp.]|nr:hypothetical protein [Humisphaera sp.]
MTRRRKRVLAILVVAFVLYNIAACLGFPVPVEMPMELLFGWITFISRTARQVHFRWDLIGSAAVYAFLLIVGSQLFLRWLYREVRATRTDANVPQTSWKWRWTLSGFAIVLLMFVSGMSVIGAIHQTTWFMRSQEPLYKRGSVRARRIRCASNLRLIGMALSMYAQDDQGKLPDDLSVLVAREYITPDVLICPASNDERAPGQTPGEQAAHLANSAHCSYIYYGKGKSTPLDKDAILALELPANHDGDGMNILYADGHVDWIDEPAAGEVLVKLGFEKIEEPSGIK